MLKMTGNGFDSKKFLAITAVALGVLAITGCEKEEDRKIARAQACLDNARDSVAADNCMAIVEGMDSKSSFLIRCSANFIAQGFTGQRVADAFERLSDDNDSGQDPMATTMAYLVFAKNLPNHSADRAVTNCQRSGVLSMHRLATMAQMATFVAATAGALEGGPLDPDGGGFDPSNISAQIANLAATGTPEQFAQVGTIAQTANEAYCGEGSAYQSNEVCTNLVAAIEAGGNDLAAIGQALLQQLQNND